MSLSIDVSIILLVLLVSLRFSALFLLSPIFSAAQIPVMYRVLFYMALSFFLVMGLEISPNSVPTDFGGILSAAVGELFVGALMAFGVFAAFAAFMFGGRILDIQMGFGVANLIDPVTNTQSPLMGTMLNLLGVMMFFIINGHHMLIRGLAYSLQQLPPGSMLGQTNAAALVSQFGVLFVYGIAIVAPAIAALLLLDAGMAVAARTMPQVNMFIVGIPLKIFIGLTVLAFSINYMGPLLEKIYSSIFIYWEEVLR